MNPRLSWIIESSRRGERQSAFEILVSSSSDRLAKNLGDLWGTGNVFTNQTTQLEYSGKPLQSGSQCFWKVRFWNRQGKASDWSKPSSWFMGLLDLKDCKAKWIGVNDPATTEFN